ncbi:putative F-box/LRR-repeat protein 23 [Panicum miliaceum]|uniref:F-box/LRR-repeat protein 23 n=1 Tax=Panicum miliaceum TaxID=4540 RepID=A0A3L6RLA9_PANMI|nr:putative F-box/LRR-repeat protein 23 [Panicum miliaceum]
MASPVRRRRCGEGMDAPPVGTGDDSPVTARDWSELPLDALATIFVKVGAVEILMGAGLVCRSWLQAAELPEVWRSVDMAWHKLVVDRNTNDDVLRAMAKAAVDCSGGRLEAFTGTRFVTDELLQYIGDRSVAGFEDPRPRLEPWRGVSNEGFTQLVARCPLLEDLLLVFCHKIGDRDVYEATGRACPRLWRFTQRKWSLTSIGKPSGDALGVAAMHELRSLTLVGSDVTNDELASVLDGCPHLELLHLSSDCFNIVSDDALRARCAGIKSLVLPPRRREVDDEDEY